MSFTVQPLQAKCIDFALTILYIMLVSIFLGWGLFHRKIKRNQTSGMESIPNSKDGGEIHSVIGQKDENIPMQVFSISHVFLFSKISVVIFPH